MDFVASRLQFCFCIVLALTVTSVLSCSSGQGQPSTLPVLVTENPDAEQLYTQAKDAERVSQLQKAEKYYSSFLKLYPEDPLVPLAQIGLGKVLLDKGIYGQADVYFLQAMKSTEVSISELARLYHGVTLHLTGKHEEALELLQPLVGRTVDADATMLLLQAIAAASELIGDSSLAIEALDQLATSPIPSQEKVHATEQILTILENRTTVDSRRELYDVLPRGGVAWPMLAKFVLQDSLENGQWEMAKTIVQELRQTEAEFDAELLGWMTRVERTSQADPRVIGAIVPMTGRGRLVGKSVLQGLMMAAGVPAEGPAPTDAFQLVFRDDAGNPAKAVQAVDELVAAHRVIAIVGPLGSESTLVASARAHELGVPLLSLSPTRPLARMDKEVFFLFPSPQEEVSRLLESALNKGHQTFAVLFPDTAYGVAMKNAFVTAAKGTRAEVVSVHTFNKETLKETLQKLTRQSLDALFFPGTSAELEMLSSVFAVSGFWKKRKDGTQGPSVAFLGTSVAFTENLPRASMRYLEGSLISCPFAPIPSQENQAFLFSEKYKERFGQNANQFSAHAFDGFRILVSAIQQGARDREALMEALEKKIPYVPLSAVSERLLKYSKDDFVCEVRDGQWVPANANVKNEISQTGNETTQ